MGFNTIHANQKSYIKGLNETNQTTFKYRQIDKTTASRMSQVDGVKLEMAQLVICVDGRCDVNVEDKLLIMGKSYIASQVAIAYNQLPLKKRKDYANIQSETVITLE